MVDKSRLASLGVVGGAVASALCCLGPLVAVTLGVSGGWLATTFEPIRPYAVAATVVLVSTGHYLAWRDDRKACEPGTLCASPPARRRTKRWLWTATGIALLLTTFPWWSKFLL